MLKKIYIPILFLVLFVGFSKAQSLDGYLATGLKNSPLLKDYSNQIRSGNVDSALVSATYKPQVNLSSQMMIAPSAKNFGYDPAITNGGNFSGLVSANQSLFNKKIKAEQFRTIQLSNQSIQVSKKLSETELKKTITNQYLTAYANLSQIKFNQSVLKLLEGEFSTLKVLVQRGIYQQTDYLNLAASIQSQKIGIRQSFIQYKNELATLNYLCGINDTTTVEVQQPNIQLENIFDLNNSLQMVQFHIDSLKNINQKALVDLNYRPQLSAFADAGFNAISPVDIPFRVGASVGVNFSMPLYDGKQRKQQYNKIFIAEETRQYYKDFYKKQFSQQYIQLKEQLKLNDELIVEIKGQLINQEQLIGLYKTEIEKGLVRFLDFLSVVNNYVSTKNNLTVAEMNRLQIMNQLNYLK
ncbi:MAG: TolC family protein [Paludibacter sp.]|nr:TolC family protein [Paludibacter sp.]